MRISNARARFTTSRPMLPSPTMPSALPRSSFPIIFFFSHLPARVEELAWGMCRAIASIRARVCSATEIALPPGVFMTSTPAAVAASRSTLSTPTPARPTTRSRGAFSSIAWFTCTTLRTSSASASHKYCAYSLGFETITFQPGWERKNSIPAAASGSAMRMFMEEVRLNASRLLLHCRLLVNLLHGGHAGSVFHTVAIGVQDDLQARHHREQIGEIEI